MEVKRINNELYHHGVKGQRWGIRRYQNADGSLTDAGKNKYAKTERKAKLKNRRSLSTEELRERIQRMKLEKEFRQLSEDDLRPGKRFASQALEKIGQSVLTSVITGATLYGIHGLITKEWNPKTAAEYIARKPKNK